MLDLAILLSAPTALPPTRPNLSIDVPAIVSRYDAPKLARIQRIAEQKIAAYEVSIADYVRDLVSTRTHIEAVAPTRPMTDEELSLALSASEDIEYEAELRAKDIKRFDKRAARDEKLWFARDPAIGAIIRSMRERLVSADERAVEALLDQALYLRAFRSQRSSGSKGGQVFEDPDDLDAFLKSELA